MGGHTSRRTSGGQAAEPTTTSAATTIAGPSGFRQAHLGETVLGTAVPRPSSISLSIVGSGTFLPSRGVPYYGPELAFRGLYYNPCWLHSYAHPAFGYGYRASVNEGDPFEPDVPTGGLRLIIEPRDGEVYVDGYYVGVVEDFDGIRHHLNLTQGPHHVEVLLPGYQSLTFDVAIAARHTVTYRGTLLPTPS